MLLERERELSLLGETLDRVSVSGGKVVLIRGEAGIGKSALIREFATTRSDSALFLFGSCDDLSTPEPLGPIWDLARFEPGVGKALASGDRIAVMVELIDLLTRGLRPTVLVVEDTHWADNATLDVIKYVGRRIAQTKGMLILTYRDGEVDLDHPLRHVIGEFQPGDIERLQLHPLSRDAIEILINTTPLDVDTVFELTAGNPLFVHELAVSAPEQIPTSVQDSVVARASKLSPRAKELLELVAVVPGGADSHLLESVLAPTPDQLAECTRLGLLMVEGSEVSFRHELARQAVEASLNSPTRQRLNRLVLDHLGPDGNPSRLLHHARRAGDVGAIVQYAPVAARSAIATGSLLEALAHFQTLMPYLDRLPDSERASVLADWGQTAFYMDDGSYESTLQQAVDLFRSVGDDMALAQTLAFSVRAHEVNGRPEAATLCAEEALTILEAGQPGPDLAFALSQRALLAGMRSENEIALEYADRAIALAREVGNEVSMISSLTTKGTIRCFSGEREGLNDLEEARSAAEAGGHHFEEVRALVNMSAGVGELGDLHASMEFSQRAEVAAARYEQSSMWAFARMQLAFGFLATGDWTRAEELSVDMEATGSHSNTQMSADQVLGTIQMRTGRSAAGDTLLRMWQLSEASGELQAVVPSAAAVAEHAWLTGNTDPGLIDRVVEIFEKATARQSQSDRGEIALWLWKLGRLESAPADTPEPFLRLIGGDARGAATEWDQRGIPFLKAIALSHTDREGRLEALDILEGLGAVAVAAKLRQEMRADGMAVPRGKGRATRSHLAGLTARQAEILQLLARGLTNTQIADHLFVSPRTVENHVSAVLTKLDAATRDEAVDRARAAELIPS